MAIREPQLGNRRPARRRVGMDFPEWLGIRKEGDSYSNPPEKPRHAENVRLVGGEMVARGGQAKFNSRALDGCLTGVFEPEFQFYDTTVNPFGSGFLSDVGGDHALLLSWSIGQAFIGAYNTGLTSPAFGAFGSALYDSNTVFVVIRTSTASELWEIKITPSGALTTGARPVASATLRGSIAGTANWVAGAGSVSCCKLGTDIWVVHGELTAADSKTYKWNGSTYTLQDAPNLPNRCSIYPAHDGGLLVLARQGSGNNFARVRSGVTGTWSNIATPAFYYGANNIAIFGSNTYIAAERFYAGGNHSVIMVYNGTTIVDGHVVVPDPGAGLSGVATLSGALWYVGQSLGATRLGKFNGATYTDVQRTISADPGIDITELQAFGIISGRLVVIANDSHNPRVQKLYISPSSAPDDAWGVGLSDAGGVSVIDFY